MTDFAAATVKVDAKIPDVTLGQELDLSTYVHFFNKGGEEIPFASLIKFALSLNNYGNKGAVSANAEKSWVLLAEQAGAVGGSLSCQGATAADTVKADITFTVKANADVTALAKKWGAIKDNFTLTTSTGFGSQVAVRTANYVSYGDGNGLIISKKDGEAYPFNFPSASDQSSVNVLPHDRGVGSEVLAKNAPAFAIGEGDFRAYTALSSALKNKYTYFIVGTPIASMMMNLGMSSTLISTSSADYYLAFLGVSLTGTDLTFTVYGISAANQIGSFGDFTFSQVGTSSIASLDKYLSDNLAPEKTDVTPLINKIKTIADGHDYTIDGTAEFYQPGTSTVLDLSKEMTDSAFLKVFIENARKARQMKLTKDGMWMHYYNVSEEKENAYDEVNYGYLNHTDGTVYSFTMENGTAVLGAQDVDYSTYSTTKAPYWNTYKKGLGILSEERITKGSLTVDKGVYSYSYAYDLNYGSPENALGTNALDLLFPDFYDSFTSSSSGTPIINTESMTLAYDDASMTIGILIPLQVTSSVASDLKITLKVSAIGSTTITGLKDILSGTPTGGGEDY